MRRFVFWGLWFIFMYILISPYAPENTGDPGPVRELTEKKTWPSSSSFSTAVRKNFKTIGDECTPERKKDNLQNQTIEFECHSKKGVVEDQTHWVWSADQIVLSKFEKAAHAGKDDKIIALIEGNKWVAVVPANEATSWSEDLGGTPKWLWHCTDLTQQGCKQGEYASWNDVKDSMVRPAPRRKYGVHL